jgi:hypothetical protein
VQSGMLIYNDGGQAVLQGCSHRCKLSQTTTLVLALRHRGDSRVAQLSMSAAREKCCADAFAGCKPTVFREGGQSDVWGGVLQQRPHTTIVRRFRLKLHHDAADNGCVHLIGIAVALI